MMMENNIPEEPQPIEEYELVDDNKMSSSLLNKFLIFMAVELIIAVFAVGYFLNSSPWGPGVGAAPVETFNPNSHATSDKKTNVPSLKQNGGVLGVQTTVIDDTKTTPAVTYKVVTPGPSTTPSIIPKKQTYKIAVYGDSMVETLGPTCEFIQKDLKAMYPDVEFLLYNYGIGAQNVEAGLNRFEQPFKEDIRNYPAIPELKPDILIIGSFAYNPFSPYDRNQHWIDLTQLVQKAKKVTPNVYMLAEQAPLRATFGDGPSGVNWDTNTSIEHSNKIIEQLENAVGLSKTLNVPLIDVYTPSLVKSKYGKEGNKDYVSAMDGIHYSVEGNEFTADITAKKLVLN
jgi:hypothetical protein